MKIRLLLFGVLAEKAGTEELEIDDVRNLEDLRKEINRRYPDFNDHKYNFSVNRSLVRGNKVLKGGDEVALLPPFAGG